MTPPTPGAPDAGPAGGAGLLFAVMAVLWGIPYLFIKVAVDHGISPGFLAWARVTIGAVVLLPLAWRAGALRGLAQHWKALLAYTVAEIVVPFPAIAFGERRVGSSLAAILIATAPLCVAVLALRFDRTERATGRRLLGLLIGLAGVVALVGIDVVGHRSELIGAAAILVAALGYAIGPLVVKVGLASVPPLGPVAASLTLAALLLAPAAALSAPASWPPARAVGALVVLGLVCSAAAFLVYFALIARVGAGRALIVTYLNPVVAVAVGLIFLGERPGVGALLGLVLILAGSRLSAAGSAAPARGVPRSG